MWSLTGLNRRLPDYESGALTNWAKGPSVCNYRSIQAIYPFCECKVSYFYWNRKRKSIFVLWKNKKISDKKHNGIIFHSSSGGEAAQIQAWTNKRWGHEENLAHMYPTWFPSINRLFSWQTFSRVDVDLREYFWSPGCFVPYLQILAHHKAVLRNISNIARRKRPKITCLNQTKRIRFKQLN